jgi:glutathione S-transferase
MKLLNAYLSPFASRARLAIYAKNLPVRIEPANLFLPDYSKDPAYLAVNPIGRVPTLVLDDGSAIPESQVIVEYLADAFPDSRLRPTDARAAAQARLLAHLVEVYVQMPAGPLFAQLFAEQHDPAVVEAAVAAMDEGLGHIEHFITPDAYAVGDALTLADCALVPFLFFFAERMVATFERPSIIRRHPKLSRYWSRVQADPAARCVLDEMKDWLLKSPLRVLCLTQPDTGGA